MVSGKTSGKLGFNSAYNIITDKTEKLPSSEGGELRFDAKIDIMKESRELLTDMQVPMPKVVKVMDLNTDEKTR